MYSEKLSDEFILYGIFFHNVYSFFGYIIMQNHYY